MVSVSIVVPIYNVEKYLDECLGSIENQTLKDIEVICVDDGSKDSSVSIVKRYMEKDPRFKLITKPNAGYGDSMNRGFDLASGEYVGIVESDDYVEPDMFEILYRTAKEKKCEVVKSDYFEFTTKNKNNQIYINTVDDGNYDQVINYRTSKRLFHYRMNTWTGIYLNDFVKENKIKHNLTPGAAYQDNGFWFQTLSLANRIVYVNRAFYHYRQDNPNSSINSKSKVYCMCDEYKYIEEFINSHDSVKKDLYNVFLVKKFYNYMYTYRRVADEHKLEFLHRFADEYRDLLSNGTVTESSCGRYVRDMLVRIVKSPEVFYYEDTIWGLQHDIIEKDTYLSGIKANRYYSFLHKLRLI